VNQQLLRQLKQHGVTLKIRKAPLPSWHSPLVATQGATEMAKNLRYVGDWEQVGVVGKRFSSTLTREEALQLISDGALDEAGLTP